LVFLLKIGNFGIAANTMKIKKYIVALILLLPLVGYSHKYDRFDDDSTRHHYVVIMDSLLRIMLPDDTGKLIYNDTIIKYCEIGLAINKTAAEHQFFDGRLIDAFFRNNQYDSVLKYGDTFLKRHVREKDFDLRHDFFMGKNLQHFTCYYIYCADTTRHKYGEALKYILLQHRRFGYYGSGTGKHGREQYYYKELAACYVALGKQRKANEYKSKYIDGPDYE
jgi:hypothetical protein